MQYPTNSQIHKHTQRKDRVEKVGHKTDYSGYGLYV